jgi:hypothetical protein
MNKPINLVLRSYKEDSIQTVHELLLDSCLPSLYFFLVIRPLSEENYKPN